MYFVDLFNELMVSKQNEMQVLWIDLMEQPDTQLMLSKQFQLAFTFVNFI